MVLRKSTLYALYAAMELARARSDRTVTAAEVAERYGVPMSVVAKVFQQLVRSAVAVGTRGQRGGYRLARPAAEITLLDVIEIFEPAARPENDGATVRGAPDRDGAARLSRVFDEVDELVRCTYASISLETVTGGSPG